MTRSSTARAFAGGLLVANSLPHLATGAAGRRHLTPFPALNAVWGAANLAGGLALLLRRAKTRKRWDGDLPAFEAGVLTFATWMAVVERLAKTNWDRAPR